MLSLCKAQFGAEWFKGNLGPLSDSSLVRIQDAD
jgi:hypothetical protein